MILRSVVLPAPLAPMMAIFSPRLTVRSTESNTTCSPKALPTPSTRATSEPARAAGGKLMRMVRRWVARTGTSSSLSSAFCLLCAMRALLALARNRSTSRSRRSRSRATLAAAFSSTLASSARWRAYWL